MKIYTKKGDEGITALFGEMMELMKGVIRLVGAIHCGVTVGITRLK